MNKVLTSYWPDLLLDTGGKHTFDVKRGEDGVFVDLGMVDLYRPTGRHHNTHDTLPSVHSAQIHSPRSSFLWLENKFPLNMTKCHQRNAFIWQLNASARGRSMVKPRWQHYHINLICESLLIGICSIIYDNLLIWQREKNRKTANAPFHYLSEGDVHSL